MAEAKKSKILYLADLHLFYSISSPDSENDPYEFKRARELNQKYGSGSCLYDFVFDLHNTTSNMGSTLLLCSKDDVVSMHLANYLQVSIIKEQNVMFKQFSLRRLDMNLLDDISQKNIYNDFDCLSNSGNQSMPCYNFLIDIPKKDNIYLQNIGKHSFCIELGPQPQGVTRADVLSRMRQLVNCGLDFIELLNQGKEFPSFETDIYRVLSRVDYPRDSFGEISAFIHNGLQDKDYVPLKPGDPIFTTINGEDLFYDGEKVVYPTFINEAAYYEKKVAFVLTDKVSWEVPALKLETPADHPGTPK
ncbi:unnamed protein product [Ranitomeya imitator]|uniref:N-acyl-aromatic-L-amino acid amidohydrolase n=1 Tax=Ranitomeya imitator TaxID=111125 RepID=A0ABN9LPF8_9NEOB|nr:unnamed protein product [Ranitomeya imitator]